MDLMFSYIASGFVEHIGYAAMDYGVWDVIFKNVAALNSVSLKALSNESIFDTMDSKASMLQEALFPISTFQHVLCEVDYRSFVRFSTLDYCALAD